MVWYKFAATGELAARDVVGKDISGVEVAVYKLDNAYYATNNICTHQRAFMSDGYVENGCVECPLHQAIFDIKTGAVLEGPTKTPLATYPVKVENDVIFVDLP